MRCVTCICIAEAAQVIFLLPLRTKTFDRGERADIWLLSILRHTDFFRKLRVSLRIEKLVREEE